MAKYDLQSVQNAIVEALKSLIAHIPASNVDESDNPLERSMTIISRASAMSAAVSGTLAIPPGPLGLLTIIPDLISIWKIQQQMVADVAGAYGKNSFLGPEQMLYCLFRHAAGTAVKDIASRVGERILIRRASLRSIQQTLEKIGIKVTQRLAGEAITRYIPILGAAFMAAYGYRDTKKVGKNAIELFSRDIGFDSEASEPLVNVPVK